MTELTDELPGSLAHPCPLVCCAGHTATVVSHHGSLFSQAPHLSNTRCMMTCQASRLHAPDPAPSYLQRVAQRHSLPSLPFPRRPRLCSTRCMMTCQTSGPHVPHRSPHSPILSSPTQEATSVQYTVYDDVSEKSHTRSPWSSLPSLLSHPLFDTGGDLCAVLGVR